MTAWIVSASVLAAAVILLRLLFRRHIGHIMQYALWGIVLLRLLIPFSLFSSAFSVANIFSFSVPQSEVYVLPISQEPATEAADVHIDQETGAIIDAASTGYTTISEDGKTVTRYFARMTIEDILLLIWAAGGAALGLWLMAANIVFAARLRRSRTPLAVPGCRLRVFVSDRIASPCLFGLLHPAIYLTPKAVNGNTAHIVAHELCHYRHGDHLWSALRCVCLAVWWWNPLVWIAAFMSRTDGELACDEAAIRLVGEENRLAYGRTLVDMIAVKKPASGLLYTATTMVSGKRGIKERLNMIVTKPKKMISAAIIVLLAAVLVAGCTFTGARKSTAAKNGVYLTIECDTPIYAIGWADASNNVSGSASPADSNVFAKGERVLVTDAFDAASDYVITAYGKNGEALAHKNLWDDFSSKTDVELELTASMEIGYIPPTYGAMRIEAGRTVDGSVSPLTDEGAALAEDILMDAMVKSAAFEGWDISQITDGWLIRQTYPNGETNDYYAYIITEGTVTGAVLQGGSDGMYTRIDDELYQRFVQLMEKGISSTGGADEPQSVAHTASYDLTSMRIDDSDCYLDAVADFLTQKNGQAPEELWLCDLWTDAGSGQTWYALAQDKFDGEASPELYCIRDQVIAYTDGSDPFAVNYTVYDDMTIVYGASFAFDGKPIETRSITAKFADIDDPVTAEVAVPISDIELRLENSANKSWAREYFILAGTYGGAPPESISALTDAGQTITPQKRDGRDEIFTRNVMRSVVRVDRTDASSVAEGFLLAYLDKLCSLDSDLGWNDESQTWLGGLIAHSEDNYNDIALLRQWIEYIKYISESGYDAEQDIGRYASFIKNTGDRFGGDSAPTISGYFRTSAFGTYIDLWMEKDADGNWRILKVEFPDWPEYNNFCTAFKAYMKENGYKDYNKAMYFDHLREADAR